MIDKDRIREFIEHGSVIAGTGIAEAVGLLSASPQGMIAAAALGPAMSEVFKRTCLDIYDRATSRREKVRSGAAVAYAVTQIAARIRRGEQLRDDGFFNSDIPRSSADEILEGVIIKSKNEHEEKKTRYYANIFVMAAFDSRFTPAALNQALIIAERLTYRQLCLLHLFSLPQPIPLRDHDYGGAGGGEAHWETVEVLVEASNLFQINLIQYHHPGDDTEKALTGMSLMGLSEIYPSRMIRTALGNRLHYLMQLQALPREDLEEVASLLKD